MNNISEMTIKYGDTGQGYITLRARRQEDGTHQINITDAFMEVKDENVVKNIVLDFKRRLEGKAETVKVEKPKKVAAAPKPKTTAKRPRHVWTDKERDDAARRYAAGEDVDQIASDHGSTRASLLKIMQKLKVKRGTAPKVDEEPAEVEPIPDGIPAPGFDDKADKERQAELKAYRESQKDKKPFYLK